MNEIFSEIDLLGVLPIKRAYTGCGGAMRLADEIAALMKRSGLTEDTDIHLSYEVVEKVYGNHSPVTREEWENRIRSVIAEKENMFDDQSTFSSSACFGG